MDEATLQKILDNGEKNGISREKLLAAINGDGMSDDVRELLETVLCEVEKVGQPLKKR